MRRPIPVLPALACALALALFTVPAARASLGPPVRITLERPGGPAEPGRTWEGRFRLTAAKPLEVSEIRVEAPGWSGVTFDRVGTADLAAGATLDVAFSGVPSTDEATVTVVLYAAGREVRQTFVVSRRVWEQTVTGAPDRELPASPQRLAALARLVASRPAALEPRPDPTPAPERPEGATARRETMTGTTAARNITVTGRIVYTRPDGVEVPVDGATVRAYD
jgi:hypothetical protein